MTFEENAADREAATKMAAFLIGASLECGGLAPLCSDLALSRTKRRRAAALQGDAC